MSWTNESLAIFPGGLAGQGHRPLQATGWEEQPARHARFEKLVAAVDVDAGAIAVVQELTTGATSAAAVTAAATEAAATAAAG